MLLVELFACVGVFTGVDSVFGYDCLLWYCCGLFVSVVWIVLLGVLFEWWVIVLSIIARHLFTWLCLCYYGDFDATDLLLVLACVWVGGVAWLVVFVCV